MCWLLVARCLSSVVVVGCRGVLCSWFVVFVCLLISVCNLLFVDCCLLCVVVCCCLLLFVVVRCCLLLFVVVCLLVA